MQEQTITQEHQAQLREQIRTNTFEEFPPEVSARLEDISIKETPEHPFNINEHYDNVLDTLLQLTGL